MNNNGWIKLHRQTLESAVWLTKDANLFKVWSYCLLKASHKPHQIIFNGCIVNLDAGQFVFGRDVAAIELNMDGNVIYRNIKKLEKMGNIALNPTTKYTLVTLENWAFYQGEETKTDSKPTANRQQTDTYKNVKNVKKSIGLDAFDSELIDKVCAKYKNGTRLLEVISQKVDVTKIKNIEKYIDACANEMNWQKVEVDRTEINKAIYDKQAEEEQKKWEQEHQEKKNELNSKLIKIFN